MWPWDHVALAYIAYSAYARLRGHGRPSAVIALAVVLAAVAPDLIDKPLAWVFAVLPSGKSFAHSVFTALAAVVLAFVAEYRLDRPGLGAAVAAGWGTHLVGDVVYPLVVKGELHVSFLLWPLTEAPSASSTPVFAHVTELALAFVTFLSTPRGTAYLLADLALLLTALALWLADGAPVLRDLWRAVARPERE